MLNEEEVPQFSVPRSTHAADLVGNQTVGRAVFHHERRHVAARNVSKAADHIARAIQFSYRPELTAVQKTLYERIVHLLTHPAVDSIDDV